MMTRRLVLLLLILGLTLNARDALDAPDVTEPNPKLSAEQVIAIQLRALRDNAKLDNDRGIKITFNFASPSNRQMTGPLPRFIEMVKNPLYVIMFTFERCERGPLEREGNEVRQRVTLIDKEGKRAIFLFVLSKQKLPPYRDCWMTDSVFRVNPDHEKPQVASRRRAARKAEL
jgi:hypothetical protein